MAQEKPTMIREAVAVFHDEQTMDAAIDDLEEHGFDRADVSLMASEQAIESKLGHRYERLDEIADDPSAPRTVVVTPEERGAGEGALIGGLAYVGAVAAAGAVVASGGALLPAALAALGAGAGGGVLGGVLAHRLGEQHARETMEHLTRGGLLLWVHCRDAEHEKTAVDVLSGYSDRPVRVHEIPWQDPKAGPGPDVEKYDVGIPWLFRTKG